MKKILVLSDIHGRLDSLRSVLADNRDIALVLVAGDLTNFGGFDAAKAVIEELETLAGNPPIALVPGNCDPLPARKAMEASGYCLDGHFKSFGFCGVAGAGGGLRRAGITSFERTENELRDSLTRALGESLPAASPSPLIVMTHCPPYGTNADRIRETHAGSVTFADLMLAWTPALWVCGHIHESRCISREDGILVVNPGPCALGRFAVVEIKEGRGQGSNPGPGLSPGLPSLAGAYLSN
jgi:uncharacterized protein